jgi:hypothetical protein
VTPIRKGTAKPRVTIVKAASTTHLLNQCDDGKYEHVRVEPGETVYLVEIPEPYATLCRPRFLGCATHPTALNWAAARMESLRQML